MPSKKAQAANTDKPAMASGTVTPPPSSGALAATDPAVLTDILRSSLSSDAAATGASAVLGEAAASAQPGQEPQVAHPINDMNPTADWEPGGRTRVDLDAGNAPIAPIHELADARALPDVTGGVHQAPVYIIDSPLAIRAFKDDDGRSMAVVWTGYTLAKAAITD